MVSAGRVLIMPKGAWNTTDTYSMLDLVSYNGSSYVAKQSVPANTLPTNTTYWQLSAYGGSAANLAGNFATLETTDYASQDYNVHDFLVTKDSQFCEVIADISSGDEIVVDTNVKATDVGKLIQAVIASINNLDAENVKLKGKTAITTQTDLDDLTTIGNYYKKNTSVYVTNAPTGINEEITAVFRLTVENGSDDTDTLIQTIVQDNGNTYKRSYDGTNWSSWDQVVYKSSLGTAAAKNSTSSITQNSTDLLESGAAFTGLAGKVSKSEVAPVESTSSASRAYAIGEQFYYEGVLKKATANIAQGGTITPGTNCTNADTLTAQNQTLTQKTDDIEDNQRFNGCFNLCPNNLTSQTFGGVQFTVNANKSITMTPTSSVIGGGINIFEDSNNPIVLEKSAILYFGDNTYPVSLEIIATYSDDSSVVLNSSANKATLHSGNIKRVRIYFNNTFNQTMTLYPMISYYDGDYVPHAMTNRELTEYTSDVASDSYTKDGILVRVYRCGRQVMFLLGGKATADIAAATVLCTLDSKFAPFETANSIAIKGANKTLTKLNIATNGQVYFDDAIANGEGPRLTSLCYIAKNP